MCQAKVFLGDHEVARDVIWLEPIAEGVRFATFFGGLQVANGRVQRIDFLTHRVVLAPLEEGYGRDSEATGTAATLDRAQQ